MFHLRKKITKAIVGYDPKVKADYCAELAQAAEDLFKEVEKIIPTLKYEPYSVAIGNSIYTRTRASAPGIRKFTISEKWDSKTQSMHMTASDMLDTMISLKTPKALQTSPGWTDGDNIKRLVTQDVLTHLTRKYEKTLQVMLDALRPDSDSLIRAQEQMHANKKRAHEMSRKHALVRLSDAMRGFDYSKDEVLEAWRMSQVERVMET